MKEEHKIACIHTEVEGRDTGYVIQTEKEIPNLPFPKAALVMLFSKFFETITLFGIRAILVVYLTQKLGYDDDTATIIFHLFLMVSFLACVFGAIISDAWLGSYRTILWMSTIYVAGSAIVSIGSISTLPIPERELTLAGLFLVAVGCGSCKPCYQAIGGDQFKLPEQNLQILLFFSLFSMMINGGTLVALAMTPILRHDVQCLDEPDCYPLAFGVPGFMMVLAFLMFLAGKRLYIIKPPNGNMVAKVAKCIGYALRKRFQRNGANRREHWLDYAEEKYGASLVHDSKCILNVSKLFIPLPLFWTLYDLQGSRWTLQATKMNGDIGFYHIKPDQMQLVSPILILILIPSYQWIIYPLLAKIGIGRPLQKLTMGGILVAIGVMLSGFVELKIESSNAVVDQLKGMCQLRIYNGQLCDYAMETEYSAMNDPMLIRAMEMSEKNIMTNESKSIAYKMTPASSSGCPTFTGVFHLKYQVTMNYHISHNGVSEFYDEPQIQKYGKSIVRVLVNSNVTQHMEIVDIEEKYSRISFNGSSSYTNQVLLVRPSMYDIRIDGTTATLVDLPSGSISTVLVTALTPYTYRSSIIILKQMNSVHMAWQLPQYLVVSLAGAMYIVVGMSFTYSEGPANMKAVMQSIWLFTIAIGHILDILIVAAKFFESQAYEFFLFAGLMFADMVVFGFLASRYKSVKSID